jgi:branched-chain amino acid transport system ATP-binding protein
MNSLLCLSDLSRSFGYLPAVAGVDLHLAPGARHAVIGPNGAGKTTLLNLIAGTLRPDSGRISFQGRDITTTSAAHRSRLGIARTFQTPALCATLTALDNVILGAWRHAEWAAGALRPHRHRRLAGRCLDQLDTLGVAALAPQPVHTLSHGQRRLVEIAVALAGRPRLLLLDEPAAGLATADLPHLISCLRTLPSGVAVLLVEHHQQLVDMVADTVTVLHHGATIAAGTPAEVAAAPAVADVYLGRTGTVGAAADSPALTTRTASAVTPGGA